MSQTNEEATDLFVSGKSAVYLVGSLELHDLEQGVNETFSMGVFQPPVPTAGDHCYIQDHIDMAMSMNAASPNKEEARTFLEWIGSEEFSALYANALPGFFPLSKFKVAQWTTSSRKRSLAGARFVNLQSAPSLNSLITTTHLLLRKILRHLEKLSTQLNRQKKSQWRCRRFLRAGISLT